MGKIPCLDCNEPFDIPQNVELDMPVNCSACGSDFIVVAVEPLEIEWSYEDYNDYDYDDDDLEEDEWDDDDEEDEWDEDEWSNELWTQQFAKKRVTQQDRDLNATKRGQTQPSYQDA